VRLLIPILFSLTFSALYAEPAIVVAPLDKSFGSELKIIRPADPDFASISDLKWGSNVAFFRPIVPYSILVENMTSKAIVEISVAVDIVTADGSRISMTQRRKSGFPPSRVLQAALPAGGAVLFSADLRYTSVAGRMFKGKMPRHSAEPASAEEISLYRSAMNITFTLDSVLFGDGQFAGPDKAKRFDVNSSNLLAQRLLGNAVLAHQNGLADQDDDALRSFLADTIASARLTPPTYSGAPISSTYARSLKQLASLYMGVLDTRGAMALFDFVRSNQSPPGLTVHR
jgi:hypothetical protein